jgi:hypothetical protein
MNVCVLRFRPNRVTIFERREGGSGLVPEIVKVLPKVHHFCEFWRYTTASRMTPYFGELVL